MTQRLFRDQNHLYAFLLTLVMAVVWFLDNVPIGNEEHYIGLTKQFFDPSWIQGAFTFDDPLGTRLFFSWVLRPFLALVEIETLVFWGRLVAFTVLSWSLGLFLSSVLKSVRGVIVVVSLFFLAKQSLVGGEWVFGGLGPKVMSYPFAFLALKSFYEENFRRFTFWAVIASFFHVLVGGWLFFFFGFWSLFFEKRIRWKESLIYLSSLAPLVFYIASSMSDQPREMYGITYDFMMSYYRNPHHTTPFSSSSGAMIWKWYRILAFAGVAVASAWFLFFKIEKPIRRLAQYSFTASLILVLFFVVAYFDSQGMFLKYYLWRFSSLHWLVFLTTGVFFLKDRLSETRVGRWSVVGALIAALAFGMWTHWKHYSWRNPDRNFQELAGWARENTDPTDKFDFDIPAHRFSMAFMRLSRRDLLVAFKFTTTPATRAFEWYRRWQGIMQPMEQKIQFLKAEDVRYFVTLKSRELDEKIAWQNEIYRVYDLFEQTP